MADFQFIIPVTKIDAAKRLVYGTMTEEVVDKADEILDYESSAPHFRDWSDQINKASDGKSLGNMRLMHQPIIAGKLVEIDFLDDEKRITCCGKVVDDKSWELVEEGCITGFSFGGNYLKRWKDPAKKGVTRFTARPVEVSIVDNPCLGTATFEYIKADGALEVRKFHAAGDGTTGEQSMEPTQEQIAEKALELAKAAGTPDAVDSFMDEAKTLLAGEIEVAEAGKVAGGEGGEEEAAAGAGEEEAPAAKVDAPEGGTDGPTEAEQATAALEAQRADVAKTLVQVWQAPDGRTAVKKGDLVETLIAAPAAPPAPEESEVEKALRLAREGEAGETGAAPDLADLATQLDATHKGLLAANEHLAPLTKGLYEVRELASLVQQMSYVVSCSRDESIREGDGSAVPEQLYGAIRQMGAALISMAQEEVGEMLVLLGAGSGWADAEFPISEQIVAIVELAALADDARKSEPTMEKAGVRAAARKALAAPAPVETGEEEEEQDGGDAAKALQAENVRLQGEVTKAVDGIAALGVEMAEMREKLEKVGKEPGGLPPRTDHLILERGGGEKTTITTEMIAGMTDVEKADLAIRLSQQRPMNKLPE